MLDGSTYGDESLLVISAPAMDVKVGQETDVTGVVRQFAYGTYADDYGLADDAGLFGDFDQEEFLVAEGPAASAALSAPVVVQRREAVRSAALPGWAGPGGSAGGDGRRGFR